MSWCSFDVWSFMTMTMMIRMINWWRFMTVVIVYDDVAAESHRNQLMGFPNAKSSPHPPFLPWFIKWLFHQAATKRTIFVSTEDVQSTPAYLQRCDDGSWWLHCNWLKSPKQQSTQTWAPTLKQTHLKNTLWYTMWYIAMASILECWGINDEMVGGFWVWTSIS